MELIACRGVEIKRNKKISMKITEMDETTRIRQERKMLTSQEISY